MCLAAMATAFTLAACDGGEYETHSTRFFNVPDGGMTFYADETLDSCGIESFDSWTASTDASDWLAFSPTGVDVPGGYYSVDWFYVKPSPNTTDYKRAAMINVDSYHDVGLYVEQSPNLNIGRPTATTPATGDKLNFVLDVNPSGARDSISFTIYSDEANLSGGDEWAGLPDSTFTRGEHKVYLNVMANLTGNRRQTSFTLTSAGVSNTINVTQDVPTAN